ncbi:MAG: transcription-repair coupling factor [Nitrospirae bacterium]|nr:transcription-repair coupling factor [Nitrospirota bacterium]
MDLTVFSDWFKAIPLSSRIYNLSGSSVALFLAFQERPFIMVESTEEEAVKLYKDILFYKSVLDTKRQSGIIHHNILFLPEHDSPELSGRRAETVYNLKEGDSLVASKDALKSGIWMPDELRRSSLLLKKQSEMSRDILEQKLISIGYKRVSIVVEHGEFSRRGWLFDIFSSTADDPIRIEFFGDSAESIKIFDVNTQKSKKEIDGFTLLPASEPKDGADIFSVMKNAACFYSDSLHPDFSFHEGAVALSRFSFEGEGFDAGLMPMTGCGIDHKERKSIDEFPYAVKKLVRKNKVVIVSSSRGQAERIKTVLMNGDVIAPLIEKEDIIGYEGNVLITVGDLSSGLFIHGLLMLSEKEIFGGRPSFRPLKKSKVSELLISLDDLNFGDYVVHEDHGIGRFVGIAKQMIEGYEDDLMVLEYSGGDRLYLPLYGINRIKKYHAEEGIIPKADRLGGKTWQRTKERVRKKIKEMAGRLLNLYAERQVSRGFSFSPDTELHREFDDFFPYEETADQIKATEEIKADMEAETPMDRLLCGDVGYGKTEVAMKAAFKSVYDGRQVVILVPTTLLCEQHYRTFRQRFSAFPVTVDYLSRFKSIKEQADTIKRAVQGNIDILIGTHSLLRKDVALFNLGLLIIDEEHRFGVAQKERLKELKKGVDVLTLTATPIPRTLNMSLSGIRNMSLIETSPEERLAVRTIVSAWNDQLIKEVIERELGRGGQTYFVHNRIHDIEKIYNHVSRLVPQANISVAHGRIRERELEKIMQRFIEGKIDLLISTAIIGSGLDIPNANTIIIDRADRMGLAGLYQLKGRVGRSNIRAYAYLLIPGDDIITDEAKKRLQAVQDMSYLGAGFRLAMRDLEIRGTGNLLGPQQSGHIHAVGFDMYMEMLEKSVAELRGIKAEKEIEPHISLRVSAFISEELIEDVTLRLSIYRRIAMAREQKTLDSLLYEIKDRFGSLPAEVYNVFDIMRLKILAKGLMITDITDVGGNIRVIFSKDTKVDPDKVFKLRDFTGGKIRFLQDGFELKLRGLAWNELYRFIKDVLEKLY